MSLPPLDDAVADCWAREFDAVERRVLMACSDRGEPQSSDVLAACLEFPVSDIHRSLAHFEGKSLIEVKPARFLDSYEGSGRFAGSGYILNERGVAVKNAIIQRFKWAQKLAGL